MTVRDFERAVWEKENIRIVIRATENSQVGEYTYANAADRNWRITQLIENRLKPFIGDGQVVVIQGDGTQPHGSVKLETLRASYGKS